MHNTTRSFLFCGLLLAGAFATPAHAQEEGDLATKWKVNDENPKASIPSEADRNQDPLEFAYFLQDLAARAEGAVKKSNWQNAVKYYEALGHAVRDAGISYRRLCLAYGKLGKPEIAAAYCGKAITMRGATVYEHFRLIENSVQLAKLTDGQMQDVEASLQHLREHVKTHPQPDAPAGEKPAPQATGEGASPPRQRTKDELTAAVRAREEKRVMAALRGDTDKPPVPVMNLPIEVEFLNCRIAVRTNDGNRLGSCIEELRRLKVSETQLVALSWTHALLTNDKARAQTLLDKAQSLGVPEAAIASMTAQRDTRFPRSPVLKFLPAALVIVVLAAGLAYLRARQRKTSGRLAT